MSESILRSRRKFVVHAIDHLFSEKRISGRKAADMYANLLGFESNNKLNYLLERKDPKALQAVEHDWGPLDEHSVAVFQRYIPGITDGQIFMVHELTEPSWSAANGAWRPHLIALLKSVDNLLHLRCNYTGSLCDDLPYLIITLADGQTYNDKARNRFLIICSLLMHLVRDGKISALRWQDIAYLYQPESFQCVLDMIYHLRDGALISDLRAQDLILEYADKDWAVFKQHNPNAGLFNLLFGELGVNISTNSLSEEVDIAIFGNYNGLNAYKLMQINIYNDLKKTTSDQKIN
jgi:hypothetical protein